MFLRGLEVLDFRCYDRGLWHFSKAGALLVGPNGAGKTSILEAIAKIAILRGFGSDTEMVRWGASAYRIRGLLAEGLVEVRYERGRGTQLLWQGEVLQPLRLWVGRIPLVVFRPGDTEWIEGPGAIRRRWADRLLSQFFPEYLQALVQYERVLAQRNAILTGDAPDKEKNAALWEKPLMEAGLILQERREWLTKALKPLLEATHAIEGVPAAVELRYRLSVPALTPEAWQQKWASLRKEEICRGRTLIGPHTEDFQLLFNSRPARGYTSEGQKKWLLIALRWAEVRLFNQFLQRKPLLLLDDLGEKLDAIHLQSLGKMGGEAAQVFVTDVEERRGRGLFPDLPVIEVG